MLNKIILLLLSLLFITGISLNAQSIQNKQKEVNIFQITSKIATDQIVDIAKKNASVLHINSEGQVIMLFTEMNFKKNDLVSLLTDYEIKQNQYYFRRSESGMRNSRLFRK